MNYAYQRRRFVSFDNAPDPPGLTKSNGFLQNGQLELCPFQAAIHSQWKYLLHDPQSSSF